MPNGASFYITFINFVNYLFIIEYKKIIVSFSYIYYATVFFIVIRVLVYFGLTLVNLVNSKHTTNIKQFNMRSCLNIFLKFYEPSSFKNIFLKLVIINCL